MRGARALLPLLALLALAGCFDFDADLETCLEAGHPCASVEPGPDDDGGGEDTAAKVLCTSDLECQSGRCDHGCCDSECAAVAQVVAGDGFTCARLETGRVRCWGRNDVGQLGLGSVSGPSEGGGPGFVPVPTDVPGLADVRELAAGADFACARLGDGTVRCWGQNDSGQLGRGPAAPASGAAPAPVLGLVTAQRLAAGYHHACALLASGVRCWGNNDYGQLGDGSATTATAPVAVCGSGTGATCLGFADVAVLDLGRVHSCAQKADGSVWCWGNNGNLQLGPDAPTDTNAVHPVRVTLPAGTPTALAAGADTGCAVLGGQAHCWGNNAAPSGAHAMLGRGPFSADASSQPAPVCSAVSAEGVCTPLADVREVALSIHGGCARVGNALHCWGYDAYLGLARETPPVDSTSAVAQLADAPTPLSGAPRLLTSGVQGVAAGVEHFCARREGGVVCWGSNLYGALGTNDTRGFNADVQPQRPIW